jgi:hypothetical protein
MDAVAARALDEVLGRAERLVAAAGADLVGAVLLCDAEVVELGPGAAAGWAPAVRDAVATRDPAACVLVCPGLRRPPTQASPLAAPIVVLLGHDREGRGRARWAEVRSGGVGRWADVPWTGGRLAASVRAGYDAAAWMRST